MNWESWGLGIGGLLFLALLATVLLLEHREIRHRQKRTHAEWKNGSKIKGKSHDKAKRFTKAS